VPRNYFRSKTGSDEARQALMKIVARVPSSGSDDLSPGEADLVRNICLSLDRGEASLNDTDVSVLYGIVQRALDSDQAAAFLSETDRTALEDLRIIFERLSGARFDA
jgi:hypothetical protein